MKITLTHKEQIEVMPDAVAITITIECRGVDHATSASRANMLQNQTLDALSKLGINPDHLRLSDAQNNFNDWNDNRLKASTHRNLKMRIRQPEPETIRLIMDHLSFESDEVTTSLEWKVIDSSPIRKALLKDAMNALLKLAETAAPTGTATTVEISVDGSNPHLHRRPIEDPSLSIDQTVVFESPLKHRSTALSPSPIRFSTELTGTFELS